MGTKLQAFIGVVTGLGASFAILQQITDRRLLAFPKPEQEDRDGFYYQTLLYRRMWESNQAKSSGEFEAYKGARRVINAGLLGTRDAINSTAEFFKRQNGGPRIKVVFEKKEEKR
jgi:hypothetical protein